MFKVLHVQDGLQFQFVYCNIGSYGIELHLGNHSL